MYHLWHQWFSAGFVSGPWLYTGHQMATWMTPFHATCPCWHLPNLAASNRWQMSLHQNTVEFDLGWRDSNATSLFPYPILLFTNGSFAVNGCVRTQNTSESKQLIKTSQKSTSNPHNSSQSNSCVFVVNKSIFKMSLSSNCFFVLKMESSIHNVAFSS